jgi:hypothetical protein
MASIQKKVEEYISQRGSVKDCFKKGLINYSALSRQIIKKLKLADQSFDAVLISCRRYADQLKHTDNETKILKLLNKSQLKIRTKVCRFVLPLNTHLPIQPLHLIQGDKTINVIYSKGNSKIINKEFENEIIDKKTDLAELILISPKDADTTLGFTAFISNILSDAGINFQTVLGSYVEDVFIIENKDVAKAIDILNKII